MAQKLNLQCISKLKLEKVGILHKFYLVVNFKFLLLYLDAIFGSQFSCQKPYILIIVPGY